MRNRKFKISLRGFCVALCLALIFSISARPTLAFAAPDGAELENIVNASAEYIYRTTPEPGMASIGGEWAVLGLARSEFAAVVPKEYWNGYYRRVSDEVAELGGVLHEKKYTEYSRVIIALSAIGADARNVSGYDLTEALGDYEKTIWQGLNGPIYALLALDSASYPMPQNSSAAVQATRQMYVDRILECQLSDGGWSLFGGSAKGADGDGPADPDITGMALQALAKYTNQTRVAEAVNRALECISAAQDENGGFNSWGTNNLESGAQILTALCELGIPADDVRFVKNGKSIVDNLLSYRLDDGGFTHVSDGSNGDNQMSSEQGFYALVALQRALSGKNSLYRMGDAEALAEGAEALEYGLPGKNEAVGKTSVYPDEVEFNDIAGNAAKDGILALARRKIIDGMGDGAFAPNESMTRAQFCAITLRALGIDMNEAYAGGASAFDDVPVSSWYGAYVNTAYALGIVNGVGEGKFDPQGTITRQEAAAMVSRAAKLCGLDTEYDAASARNVLAQFTDYIYVSNWAAAPLAFCYDKGILDDSALEILPKQEIRRFELASMIYKLLDRAKLL